MKQNDYTNHNADRRSRITARWRSAYVLMLALAGIILLAPSCTTDDDGSMPGDDAQRTPVRLIAGIQQVATPATAGTKGTTPVIPGLTRDLPNRSTAPATRTAPGGTDGTQAVWTKDDYIGLFMLPTGGKIPADTLPGAHNVPYKVDPATGELTQVLGGPVYNPATGSVELGVPTPMYYPSTDEAVDFVAYYPYFGALEIDDPIIGPYIYVAGSFDQTTAENQLRADYLYSDNARNIHRSKDPVTLQFRHLMAKLRLDITLGEGFERGEVTKVTLPGMPWQVRFDMHDGSVNKVWPPLQDQPISCLPLPSPAAGTGATASFTAIVPPHEGAKFKDRKITVTVDGEDYTGTIPDAHDYTAGTMYAYPVRVTPQGITIEAPNTDVTWTDAKPLPQGYDLTVGNETELRRFAELVNTGGKLPNGTLAADAKVLQTADIELTVTQEWTPIGNGDNPFLGTYNGDGHTITGLTIKTATPPDVNSYAHAGLFGAVGNVPTDGEQGAVLTGIHLRKVQIDIRAGSGEDYLYVGSIAGGIINSTLSLCSAEGKVKASSGAEMVYAGGIAGINYRSTISRCRASVETKAASARPTDGYAFAGGISGANDIFSFILSCEAGGMLVIAEASNSARAGGITGRNMGRCLIAFCRTGANAVTAQNGTGANLAGGLVGDNIGFLYSCYSRATATATGGNNQAGAIVGYNFGQVQHCYGTGANDQGTSNLAADPDNIVYNTSPSSETIYDVMKGYTGMVESIPGFSTYYPYATRYDRAVYPAHSIEPVRVKWGPGFEVWQRGIDPKYPEIKMKYGGDDNAVPQP